MRVGPDELVELAASTLDVRVLGGSGIQAGQEHVGQPATRWELHALTFGLGHRFSHVTTQLYVRENMNLPFVVRWNTDPDMSIGLKVRIH